MVSGKLLEKAGVSCSLSLSPGTHTFTFHTLTLSLAMLATLALGHRPHLECSHSTASCSADAVALELLGAFESLLAPAPRWPELHAVGEVPGRERARGGRYDRRHHLSQERGFCRMLGQRACRVAVRCLDRAGHEV